MNASICYSLLGNDAGGVGAGAGADVSELVPLLLPAAAAMPRFKLAATCFSPCGLCPPSCLSCSPPLSSSFILVSLISFHPLPTLSIASMDLCSHSSIRALSFCPSSMRSLSERTASPSRSRSLTTSSVKPHRMNVPVKSRHARQAVSDSGSSMLVWLCLLVCGDLVRHRCRAPSYC